MRTDTDTLMEAAEIKAMAVRLSDEGIPFIMQDGKPVSLERFLKQPVRAVTHIRASNVHALSVGVRKFQNPAHNIACFWRFGRLTAYLNFHTDPENAGWCDFKITCWCRYKDAEAALKPHTVIKGGVSARRTK